MRKGTLLMDRDYRILRQLSYGYASSKNIFRNFFREENSNHATRERVMNRRMRKLERNSLVRSLTSPIFEDILYSLTDAGAALVAEKFGIEPTNIWVNFKEENALHDLRVSNAARKIIKESEELELFDLTSLELECCLRKGGRNKKGIFYPDIRFGVQRAEVPTIFQLEIDCGTVSRRDFLGKIDCFEAPILVVTSTETRLNLLMRYLSDEQIAKPVFLTLFEAFYRDTLPDCLWQTNVSKNQVKLLLE